MRFKQRIFSYRNMVNDILNHLYNSESEDDLWIRLDHLPIFKKYELTDTDNLKRQAAKIKSTLQSFHENGYVEWRIGKEIEDVKKVKRWNYAASYYNDFANIDSDGVLRHIKNSRVQAKLTPKGVDYVLEKRRNKGSVLRSRVTITLAILSAIFTGVSLYKTIVSQKESERKLQEVDSSLQIIQNLQRNLRTDTDTLFARNRRDSLNNSSLTDSINKLRSETINHK